MREFRWASRASAQRLLLLALTLLLVGIGIGLRDPWPSDEPRFVLIAQTMLSSGEWLIPQRGAELYSHKPPLFFWIQALSIKLFGIRVGFLLPALLSALLIMLMTHDLALRLYDRRIALWAGIALLALPQFVLIGRSGQIDPLVCLWVCLGLYGILRYLLDRPQAGWLIGGFLAMGLGVLTKGVGFLPLLLLPAFWFASWRGWQPLSTGRGGRQWLHWWLALAAMLAPIVIWALAVQLRASADPDLAAYRDDLFFQQTAGRYLGSDYHPKPWWYLIVKVIPVFWLPLVLLLPYLVPQWWSRLRGKDSRILLPLAWVLAVIAFFSVSGGKRGIYLAPALPALALLAAPFLEEAFRRAWVRLLFYVVALLLASSALIAGAFLLIYPPENLQALIRSFDHSPFAISMAVGAVALPAVLWLGRRRAGHGFLAVFAVSWIAYGLLLYPLLNDARSGRQLMREAESHLFPGQTLGMVGWKEQMMLQATVPLGDFGFSQPLEVQTDKAIQWLAEDRRGRQLLLPAAASSECVAWSRGRSLGFAHGRDWVLIDGDAINPDCTPGQTPAPAL